MYFYGHRKGVGRKVVTSGSVLALPCRARTLRNHAAVMRRLLCVCLVAFAGAQLRPRRVGVNPMGEETGAAEAGGAVPDMADLMKNMMGGFAARSERSKPPSHATIHRSRAPSAC